MSSKTSAPQAATGVDFTRKFMPEALTPLYHTPAYEHLTAEQRLSYNQLNALYFNEQTIFFEKSFARTVLGKLAAEPLSDALKAGLRQFMEEEEQHSEMFRQLNRKCAPELYTHSDFYFIRVPAFAQRLLSGLSRQPKLFPAFLWLMYLQEERGLFYGRCFLQSSGELEPHFVETQRKHLADEAGHVRWDQALLDTIWPQTHPILRKLNASFLAWLIGEYFSAPKRAGIKVLHGLIEKHPELRPQQEELRRHLLNLRKDQAYRCSFYSAANVPGTFEHFDRWPEFRALTRVMPGYVPQQV